MFNALNLWEIFNSQCLIHVLITTKRCKPLVKTSSQKIDEMLISVIFLI